MWHNVCVQIFGVTVVLKKKFNISDISVILKHFDEKVIQSAYEPYNGFNFYYLFVTSVCLITVSHFVNIFYWAVRRTVDPMVTAMIGCLLSDGFLFDRSYKQKIRIPELRCFSSVSSRMFPPRCRLCFSAASLS